MRSSVAFASMLWRKKEESKCAAMEWLPSPSLEACHPASRHCDFLSCTSGNWKHNDHSERDIYTNGGDDDQIRAESLVVVKTGVFKSCATEADRVLLRRLLPIPIDASCPKIASAVASNPSLSQPSSMEKLLAGAG